MRESIELEGEMRKKNNNHLIKRVRRLNVERSIAVQEKTK